LEEQVIVGKIDDVPPGGRRVFYVKGFEVVVFNNDGTLYAIDNLCPHQGGPLVAGTLKDGVLTCPWHHWQCRLESGISPVSPTMKVGSYPVKVTNGDIQITVEKSTY